MKITIPIRLKSTANIREHWAQALKRKKKQQRDVVLAWNSCVKGSISLPVAITLTRLAPRTLDFDNLCYAFKNVRDAISDCIKPGLAPGRADGEGDIVFEYKQIKSTKKTYAIIIEFEN